VGNSGIIEILYLETEDKELGHIAVQLLMASSILDVIGTLIIYFYKDILNFLDVKRISMNNNKEALV